MVCDAARLTLHHQWVGTGAWAQDYKRLGGVRSKHPSPPSSLTPSYNRVWSNCQSEESECVYVFVCARALERGD